MKAIYSLEPKVKYVCLRNYYVKYGLGNLINLIDNSNDEVVLVLEEFEIYNVIKRTMYYTSKEGKEYNLIWYDITIDNDDRFISLKEDEAKKIIMPLCDFREQQINSILDE
jgi:hypothetical protein